MTTYTNSAIIKASYNRKDTTMKKALSLILATLTLLLALSGCSFVNLGGNPAETTTGEITDPATPEAFTYGALSITLPGDFATAGKASIIENKDYSIRMMSASKSDITPQPGQAFPTVQEFFNSGITFKDKLTFQQQDGVLYADYATTSSNIASVFAIPEGSGTQLIAFFESDSAFYAVAF